MRWGWRLGGVMRLGFRCLCDGMRRDGGLGGSWLEWHRGMKIGESKLHAKTQVKFRLEHPSSDTYIHI